MPVIITKPNPYFEHLTAHSAVGTTTVTHNSGKPKVEKLLVSKEEQLSKPLVVPSAQMHTIEVGGGMTVNLGNFESARIDVRLTVPCTKDDLSMAYEFASDWVSERIQKAVAEAKGQ